MEAIFLTCVALAWFFTKGKVDTAAYANGKEPPGVAKARMRHEKGGGARSARTGRPKGPGAFRRMLAERWANSCEAAAQRANHKAARKRAWYAETAPQRDEAWRERQHAKFNRADSRRAKWAKARGLVDLDEHRRRKAAKAAEDAAWDENERRGRDPQLTPEEAAAQVEAARLAGTDRYVVRPRGVTLEDGLWGVWDRERGEYVSDRDGDDLFDNEEDARDLAREYQPDDLAELDAYARANPEAQHAQLIADGERMREAAADLELSTPSTPTSAADTNTESKGTPDMYEQAVQQLIRAADEVAEYRQQLANFADDLGGRQWGQEVWGPMADAASQLVEVEGIYRDLAGQVKAQGDAGASAYDQAPYVPGPHAVMG